MAWQGGMKGGGAGTVCGGAGTVCAEGGGHGACLCGGAQRWEGGWHREEGGGHKVGRWMAQEPIITGSMGRVGWVGLLLLFYF